MASRPTWAKHEAATKWCAIAVVSEGCVQTLCRGRWSTSDAYETDSNPAWDDRCGGCERVRICPVEMGLVELQFATPEGIG